MCMVTVPANTLPKRSQAASQATSAASGDALGPAAADGASTSSPPHGRGSVLGGGIAAAQLSIQPDGSSSPGRGSSASVASGTRHTGAGGLGGSGPVNSASTWQSTGTAGLLTGARDGSIKLWDLRTGTCVKTLRGHGRSVMALQLPPGPHTVPKDSFFTFMGTMGGIIGGGGGGGGGSGGGAGSTSPRRGSTVTVNTHISHGSFAQHQHPRGFGGGLAMKTPTSSGGLVPMLGTTPPNAGANSNAKLGVDGSVVSESFTPRSSLSATSLSPRVASHHVGHVMSCSADGMLRLWNYQTGRALRMFEGHRGPVTCMAWGMYNIAVSGGVDGSLRVWNVNTGVCLHVVHQDETSPVTRVAWKGEWVVGAFKNGGVRVWRWLEAGH